MMDYKRKYQQLLQEVQTLRVGNAELANGNGIISNQDNLSQDELNNNVSTPLH
jgi:hypothetical protein